QAAAVAEGGDLGVQRGGVVAAFGPPAAQMVLVAVRDSGPGDGPGDGLVTGGGVSETADGLAVCAEFAGDRAQAQAAGCQGLDGGVLVTHPRLQRRFGRRSRGGRGGVWWGLWVGRGGGGLARGGPGGGGRRWGRGRGGGGPGAAGR